MLANILGSFFSARSIRVIEDLLKIAELFQQLLRDLGANQWNAGNVVDRIAHHGLKIDT